MNDQPGLCAAFGLSCLLCNCPAAVRLVMLLGAAKLCPEAPCSKQQNQGTSKFQMQNEEFFNMSAPIRGKICYFIC